MKQHVKRCLEFLRRLIDFDLLYQEELKDDTSYQKVMSILKKCNVNLLSLLPKLEVDNKVKAALKKQKRDELIAFCLPFCKLAKGYGKINSFEAFANLKNFNKSELKRVSNDDFVMKLTFLIDVFTKHTAECVLAGITAEQVNEIQQKLDAFIKIIDDPQKSIEIRKELHRKVNLNCSTVRKQTSQGFIEYMEGAYVNKNKELLQNFKAAISVNESTTRKRAVIGSIVDASNECPLSKVTLTIDKQKPIVRGGAKGKFYIKHLDAGEHNIEFNLAGYQILKKKFIKHEGKTHYLEVKLQSKLVEELVE